MEDNGGKKTMQQRKHNKNKKNNSRYKIKQKIK